MVSRNLNKELTIKMVGGNSFGRYPKISVEQTINMIVSDTGLVDYNGFKALVETNANGFGRGGYFSSRAGRSFFCIGNGIYIINPVGNYSRIATLNTSTDNVFFAENEKKDIAICDKFNIYIYNYGNNTFVIAEESNGVPLDFRPGYVSYQNGRFVSVDLNTATWRLGSVTDSNYFPSDSQSIGTFQTKGNLPLAAFPLPGKSNMLMIMGSIVTEQWYNVASNALFPYQRSQNFNIDYGTLNSATIDFSDSFVAWLAYNEKSGPVIMYSDGSQIIPISTDGIDYKLSNLNFPQKSFGFLFKQDGHLIYQFTFYDPSDNISYIYDFKTKQFFTVCDENMNFHPAKKAVYMNNNYYFVSFNDNKIYELNTKYTTYDYGNKVKAIPRIRICGTIQSPDSHGFVTKSVSFPTEMGTNSQYNSLSNILITNGGTGYTEAVISFEGGEGINAKATATITDGVITDIVINNPGMNYLYPPRVIITGDGEGAEALSIITNTAPRVDISISLDGGMTFGNKFRMYMNPSGKRKNKFIYYQLGWSNEFVPRFEFLSFGRFVIGNGIASIRQ